MSEITGIPAEEIVSLARRYGASPAAFIRLGIGISRHDNGGMTCRTIACLPALTGAYAHPAGGALLSSTAAFGLDYAALERPDLQPTPAPRTINMIHLGRALTGPDTGPPVKALYVYNANPAAVCPNQELVLRGLAREDLFTVVHEQQLTDTTDWADLVLPATTSMEHRDLYKSYGHLYLQLAEPVIPPAGESRSNWQVTRALARAMALDDPHFDKDEDSLFREALASGHPSVAGVTVERLRAERVVRLERAAGPSCPSRTARPRPPGRWSWYRRAWLARACPRCPPTCRWWRAPSIRRSRGATRCSASCRPIASS